MATEPHSSRVIRFGVFEVDLQARELRRSGLKLKVHEQPFQLLTTLLEHPGEIVTREELRQKLWPANTFVDFDHGLNTAVNKLREVLGDSADSPRFIETVPRRGYRFLGPFDLKQGSGSANLPGVVDTTNAHGRQKSRIIWVAALACLSLITAAASWMRLLDRAAVPVLPPKTVPLVSYLGDECCPTFSPDGNQVAFVWNNDVYVKLIGTESALRLTHDKSVHESLGWSPDGRYIAFVRDAAEGKSGVFLIPALGGSERRVAETDAQGSGLSWFPDGNWLAVPDRDSIYLLSVDTGEKRRLTFPGSFGLDETPAFSPDGRQLVFTRHSQSVNEIYLLALSPNLVPREEPKQLTFNHQGCRWPTWTANGSEIVFSCGADELWRMPVSASGAPPQPLSTSLHGTTPAISRLGYHLA